MVIADHTSVDVIAVTKIQDAITICRHTLLQPYHLTLLTHARGMKGRLIDADVAAILMRIRSVSLVLKRMIPLSLPAISKSGANVAAVYPIFTPLVTPASPLSKAIGPLGWQGQCHG